MSLIPLVCFNSCKLFEHLNGFDNGITVTIRDGLVQAASPELAAILDTLAATLPGYGSLPFDLDADYNIARGIIAKTDLKSVVKFGGRRLYCVTWSKNGSGRNRRFFNEKAEAETFSKES